MLRLLHTADIRLGARHEDLGEAAAALRERQLGALRATADLALAERVALVVIAGDLFDTNTASRRTVEQAAAELGRLAAGRIRVVILPGEHDAYTRASVYRAYDLPGLVGGDVLAVLTPDKPVLHLDALDAVVVGPADPDRPATSPFADATGLALPSTTWRIGLMHAPFGDGPGAVASAALEASGLDFVALGGAPTASSGRAGAVTWAVPGSPEQVAADRDAPGTVNLVTLDERDGAKTVTVEPRRVGSTWHREIEVDAGAIASEAALVERLRAEADGGLIVDVRLVGERPDELVVDPAAVEDALRDAYLCIRVEDRSRPPLTAGQLPPPETVAGAFLRSVEGRIAELEAADPAGDSAEAAELREVLRLGRRALAGEEVAP